jgi:hypothetical protein
MPAQQPVPGTARVTVTGTASGIPIVNVFHVRKTGGATTPFSDAALDAIATLVGTAWDNRFAPMLNTVYTGGSTNSVDLGSDISHVGFRANTGNGIASGPHVPQSLCCCISWKIVRHYRGGHPRTYLGPLGDSAIQNNTSLAAGTVTLFGTAANNFRTDINTSSPDGTSIELAAVHRWRNKVQLTPPQTSPILSASVDNRLDTQRRRLGPDR